MKLKIQTIFLVLSLSTALYSEIHNPFNLITDKEYSSSLEAMNKRYETAKSGSFLGVDDITIKYKIFKTKNEIGAIVISSGRTESYIKYKELIYNLTNLGYSVYIHDHRGQGFSERLTQSTKTEDLQKGHVWDFDNYVTDLKTFYDLKVKSAKHKNLFLLGHSMGGAIATLYVEKYPNDFKALALNSPMHEPYIGEYEEEVCEGVEFTSSVRDFFIASFDWEPRYALGQKPYVKESFTFNNPNLMTHSKQRFLEIQKLYDEHQEVKLGGITTHWLAQACETSHKLLNNTQNITIPILVLQASQDIAVDIRGQNLFCMNLEANSKMRCETSKPINIDGGYHEMLIETDKYRIPVTTKILKFFQKNSIYKLY